MAAVEAQKIRLDIFVKKGLAQASPFRLHKAFQRVKSNKRTRAVGGMTLDELLQYLRFQDRITKHRPSMKFRKISRTRLSPEEKELQNSGESRILGKMEDTGITQPGEAEIEELGIFSFAPAEEIFLNQSRNWKK